MAAWSQVLVSQLVGALRLDAEFWHPSYLKREEAIRQLNHAQLGSLVTTFRKGIFYILAKEYAAAGVPFYRSSNVGRILPSEEGITYITKEKNYVERKTALQAGDLMIVKTGRPGASVVFAPICNVSQDVIAVKVRKDRVSPYYLAVYLNTQYGYSEMSRWFQGQVQPHLSLEDARKIWVSIPDWNIQKDIEALVRNAETSRTEAKASYDKAQSLLESELGLDKLTFDKPVSYAARFSEVSLSQAILANRIDAQCFSPTAFQYEQALSKLSNVQPLRFLTAAMVKGTQQEESPDGTIPYVSIKHIQNNEIVAEGNSRRFKGMPVAKQGDLLLAITGATIGKVGIVSRYEELTLSGDMLAITTNGSIDPHYLLAFLSHRIGQVQLQRWITGSTNGHLSPHDVGRVLIPRLDEKLEQRIASLMKESIDKIHESERLLEQAKHRVETLIEEAIAA